MSNTDHALPAAVIAAQTSAETTWKAYRPAAQAAHDATERVVAVIVRELWPTAHTILFDYDGDSDGTWLTPGPVYDADGVRLDDPADGEDPALENEQYDALTDALSEATHDLFDYLVITTVIPGPPPSIAGKGLVIPDVLDAAGEYDTTSSAARQCFIDTGRWPRKGDVMPV